MGWLSLIVPGVVNLFTGMFGAWQKARQRKEELKEEQHLTKLEIEKQKQMLARDKEQANSAIALANLAPARALKWLMRLSLLLFLIPYPLALFFPELVSEGFTRVIQAIPDVWHQLTLGALAAIWGIREIGKFKRK